MVLLPLGSEGLDSGSRLGLDWQPSAAASFLPGRVASTPRVCPRALGQSRNQESKVSQVPGAFVLCSQARHRQATSHSRPISSESLHSVRLVSYAHSSPGAYPASLWGRHHLYRSYRRLLACPNRPLSSSLSMLQAGQSSIHLQGYALRAEHSPRVFTKLADSVVQELRRQGILVAAYLDDWIVWATSKDECLQAAKTVLDFLMKLGFTINFRKLRLTLESKFEWLGLLWDLDSHTLSRSPQKSKIIATLTCSFLRRPTASRRDLERVLDSLQFASVTNPVLLHRLHPWRTTRSLSRSVPVQYPLPSLVINTDTLLSGWGGHPPLQLSSGDMVESSPPPPHKCAGSNGGVFITKKIETQGQLSCAIYPCLNRWGSRSRPINHVMVAIFSLARRCSWHLSATHLAGVRSVIADSLSRTAPLESECSLDKDSFQWIQPQVPNLRVDAPTSQ